MENHRSDHNQLPTPIEFDNCSARDIVTEMDSDAGGYASMFLKSLGTDFAILGD